MRAAGAGGAVEGAGGRSGGRGHEAQEMEEELMRFQWQPAAGMEGRPRDAVLYGLMASACT
jgi:hypothetical protein